MNTSEPTGGTGLSGDGSGYGEESGGVRADLGTKAQGVNLEKLANRIRSLAENVRMRKIALDQVAIQVCHIEQVLGTVPLPLPPAAPNLPELAGSLAGALKGTGNLALAELMVIRAMNLDFDQDGMQRWSEVSLAELGEIWDAMGKHKEAASALRQAVQLSQ